MKITLITGFLGAGKTTFLKRLLREQALANRFGVIVNDLSELEVDGELLRIGHAVSEEAGTLVSLFDGSISGERRADFSQALASMREAKMEHVLVETSGGSHPQAVIDELLSCRGATLHAVATLVDARALLHDYDGGVGLIRQLADNEQNDLRTAENLLADQLRAASVIIVTKLDMVPEDALPMIFRTLQVLNPGAQLAACAYGRLDASVLLDAPPYSRNEATPSSAMAKFHDIGSTVIRDSRPLHPQRFFEQYQQRLGLGLFRSKGFIWLASRPDQVLLWNQAGGAMGLEFLGIWRAHILATDGRLLPEEIAHLQEKLAGAHPLFGDRGCEITLIGQARDREIFAREMEACFCTEDEIEDWQRGREFVDPWPKNLRKLD
ncbi:CobW family GTP-binding protein [Phragmitibacter flavus]|nr:GTP-binding protein [Phragmitibacter flavus]